MKQLTLANDILVLGASNSTQRKPDTSSCISYEAPSTIKRDLKKEYPGILEYVKKNDCSFSEAIRRKNGGE